MLACYIFFPAIKVTYYILYAKYYTQFPHTNDKYKIWIKFILYFFISKVGIWKSNIKVNNRARRAPALTAEEFWSCQWQQKSKRRRCKNYCLELCEAKKKQLVLNCGCRKFEPCWARHSLSIRKPRIHWLKPCLRGLFYVV